MDNMLYIIAGLIIVLLLVVLVMRKNKAQRPSTIDRNVGHNKAQSIPTTDRASASQNTFASTNEATKFDNVTVAQRFVDQQRYDKAIETLQRGLIDKPHDGPLLLKLLDVYAVADQNDDFYRTYNTIQTHGDQATIEQAQQLKNSMGAQHSESVSSDVPATMNLATANTESITPATVSPTNTLDQDDFSLDFDTSYSATDKSNATGIVDTINNEQSNAKQNNTEQNNDSFDLTLDDLEATDETLADDNSDELTPTQSVTATDTTNLPAANNVTNIDDDFTFDFDDTSDDVISTTELSNPNLADDQSKNDALVVDSALGTNTSDSTDEPSLDDDFVLDLQDFATDTSSQSETEVQLSNSSEPLASELGMEDFTFDLEGSDEIISEDNAFDIDDIAEDKTLHTTDDSSAELASYDLDTTSDHQNEDYSFEFDDVDTDNIARSDTTIAIDNSSEVMGSEPTSLIPSPTSDANGQSVDDWLVDNDFTSDFGDDDGSQTVSAPIATETTTETLTEQAPVDFDSQFSADFNFVKSLDSHQVTLDLADQYLQLGEYDSAKRLLTEVITQGNSEQQQKAQALLARAT